MLNIPSTIEDPSYRYQMPRMDLKQESRLNGVKTNIFNLDDVAKSLRVPSDFIIKYMWYELGVAKEKKTIIKGKHTYEDLLVVLDQFIHKYILCPKCKLPEITLFGEKKVLKCKCRACGKIKKLDNSHKVVGHILKNIPKDMSEIDGDMAGEEADEKDGKKKKKDKKDKKEKKSKKSKKEAEKEAEGEEDKEELSEDDADELTHESEHVKSSIQSIRDFIIDKGEDLTNEKLTEEIHNVCISVGAPPDLRYYIAFNGMFTIKILEELKKFGPIWKKYLAEDGKDGIKNFLPIVCRFFIETYPKLEIAIDTFMITIHQAGILDNDEILLDWSNKKFKTNKTSCLYDRKIEKSFKKKAEKFFKWVEEAESTESESSESEEDDSSTLTEDQLKAKKMKELIEKEKLEQEQKAKAKQDEADEAAAVDNTNNIGDGKNIDVTAVQVEDEEIDIDDI